jgi:hypothetical protein
MRQDGRIVSKPRELSHSELVDGLAQRYSVPPSVILEEPAKIIRMVSVAEEGKEDRRDRKK